MLGGALLLALGHVVARAAAQNAAFQWGIKDSVRLVSILTVGCLLIEGADNTKRVPGVRTGATYRHKQHRLLRRATLLPHRP